MAEDNHSACNDPISPQARDAKLPWHQSLQNYLKHCLESSSEDFNMASIRQYLAVEVPKDFQQKVLAAIENAVMLNDFDCDAIEPQLSAFLDAELEDIEEEHTILHLATCNNCMSILADLKQLHSEIGKIQTAIVPIAKEDKFLSKVLSAIEDSASTGLQSANQNSSIGDRLQRSFANQEAVEELIDEVTESNQTALTNENRIDSNTPHADQNASLFATNPTQLSIWPRRFAQVAAAILVVTSIGIGVNPFTDFAVQQKTTVGTKSMASADKSFKSELSQSDLDDKAFEEARDLVKRDISGGLSNEGVANHTSVIPAAKKVSPTQKMPGVRRDGVQIVNGTVEIVLASSNSGQTVSDLTGLLGKLDLAANISQTESDFVDVSLNSWQTQSLINSMETHPRLQTQVSFQTSELQRARFRSVDWGKTPSLRKSEANQGGRGNAKAIAREEVMKENIASEPAPASPKELDKARPALDAVAEQEDFAEPQPNDPTKAKKRSKDSIKGAQELNLPKSHTQDAELAGGQKVYNPAKELKRLERIRKSAQNEAQAKSPETRNGSASAAEKISGKTRGLGDDDNSRENPLLDHIVLVDGEELIGFIIGEDAELVTIVALVDAVVIRLLERTKIQSIRRRLNSEEGQQRLRLRIKKP